METNGDYVRAVLYSFCNGDGLRYNSEKDCCENWGADKVSIGLRLNWNGISKLADHATFITYLHSIIISKLKHHITKSSIILQDVFWFCDIKLLIRQCEWLKDSQYPISLYYHNNLFYSNHHIDLVTNLVDLIYTWFQTKLCFVSCVWDS